MIKPEKSWSTELYYERKLHFNDHPTVQEDYLIETNYTGLCGRTLNVQLYETEQYRLPSLGRPSRHNDPQFPNATFKLRCDGGYHLYGEPILTPFSEAVRGSPCTQCLCNLASVARKDADAIAYRMELHKAKRERWRRHKEREAHKNLKRENYKKKMKAVIAKEKSELWRKWK